MVKREPSESDDSEPIRPSAKRFRSQTVQSSGGGSFPYYDSGNVEVVLCYEAQHQYKLHQAILESNSSWWRAQLNSASEWITGGGTLGNESTVYRFNLETNGSAFPMLEETVMRDEDKHNSPQAPQSPESVSQIDSPSHRGNSGQNRRIKQEPGYPNESGSNSSPQGATEFKNPLLLQAYHNLFLTYYNRSPLISTNDIRQALKQAERLIEVAGHYDSLQAVRPYIENTLIRYRKDLYLAISVDPPRWLGLALTLESTPIFTEAMIHIVGRWPHCDVWPSSMEKIPMFVKRLIEIKAKELYDMREKVNRDLFLLTIKLNGRRVSSGNLDECYETLAVVHSYNDWVCDRVQATLDKNVPYSAEYFRLIQRGGDAYLPYKKVRARLEEANGIYAWDDVVDDLNKLKQMAANIIRGVAKNNLMVGLDEVKVDYLTCTEITQEEVLQIFRGPGNSQRND